jgi:hypothetical protein
MLSFSKNLCVVEFERMRSAHAFDQGLYALCHHEGYALKFGDARQWVTVNLPAMSGDVDLDDPHLHD